MLVICLAMTFTVVAATAAAQLARGPEFRMAMGEAMRKAFDQNETQQQCQ
jgi:ribosomal protein S3